MAADSTSERVLLVSLVSDVTESDPPLKNTYKLTPSARLARSAASLVDEDDAVSGILSPTLGAPETGKPGHAPRTHSPTLEEAELAMVEFRELTTSAGGVIVGEVVQRRPRPDPATLIGKGKVQEVVGGDCLDRGKGSAV